MNVIGHVYVIESDGLVKIGKSSKPEKRLRGIEAATGRKITRKFVSPGTERFSEIETKLHRHFKEYKTLGEWFRVDFCLAVEYLTDVLNQPVREDKKAATNNADSKYNMSLTIAEDGFVGVSGGKKFESLEDVNEVVENIRRKLIFGFEHRDEMRS